MMSERVMINKRERKKKGKKEKKKKETNLLVNQSWENWHYINVCMLMYTPDRKFFPCSENVEFKDKSPIEKAETKLKVFNQF